MFRAERYFSADNIAYYIAAGTLWNLSSHDSVKMEIVDHALHALADEVVVPHSGWEQASNGGEESCKPRHLEWETALTNTAGCLRCASGTISHKRRRKKRLFWGNGAVMCLNRFPLSNRNVSSERSEARRKLRECTGLVDALMYIVQSQINRKNVDNKVPVDLSQMTHLAQPKRHFFTMARL